MAIPSKAPKTQSRRRQNRRYASPLLRSLAGVLGCLIGTVLYVRWLYIPWSVGNKANHDVAALERQWRSLSTENQKLAKHLAYLRSPAGIEAYARSRGYHRPGEQVYFEPTASLRQKANSE